MHQLTLLYLCFAHLFLARERLGRTFPDVQSTVIQKSAILHLNTVNLCAKQIWHDPDHSMAACMEFDPPQNNFLLKFCYLSNANQVLETKKTLVIYP